MFEEKPKSKYFQLYKGRDDAALRAAAVERAPTPRMETPALTISGYNIGNNTNTVSNISQKDVKPDKSEMKQELAQSGSRMANQNNNSQIDNSKKLEEKTSHDSASAKRPKTSAPELGEAFTIFTNDLKNMKKFTVPIIANPLTQILFSRSLKHVVLHWKPHALKLERKSPRLT